jgi:hypothetical protein
MVYLNKFINFNVNKLKNNLVNELNQIIKLDFEFDLDSSIINKINKSINNKMKECFDSDHFINVNMDNNVCIYKHKRGNKNGYFCHRKINTNLNGEKDDFLCVKHSKKHIPTKRITKDINKTDIKSVIKSGNKRKHYKKKLKNQFKKKIHYICNSGTLDIGQILTMLI